MAVIAYLFGARSSDRFFKVYDLDGVDKIIFRYSYIDIQNISENVNSNFYAKYYHNNGTLFIELSVSKNAVKNGLHTHFLFLS